MAQTFYLLDIENVSAFSIDSGVKDFLLRAIKICGSHYPERLFMTCIINAPMWFSGLWRFLKPFINKKTRNKVRICSSKKEYMSVLEEYIDINVLPPE